MSSRRRSASKTPSKALSKSYSSWSIYNLLVATALVANALAVILNGLSIFAYSVLETTPTTQPIYTSLIVGIVFGLFAFLWALIVVVLVTRMRSLGILSKLLALTSVVTLVAALSAGWFAPDPEVVATYPIIGAYKGATVALYSVNIVLYLALALMVMARA